MSEIEKRLVNEFSLDEDSLWELAAEKYNYPEIKIWKTTGMYSEDGVGLVKILLWNINNIADEVLGSSSQTKDF